MNDGTALVIVLIALGGVLYFLPSIVACKRNHHNNIAIFLVNLFFGWTGIGWMVALIWAFSNPAQAQVVYIQQAPWK
jgi:hypothetical protein